LETRQTIAQLYAAFARLDADGMAACYAPDAVFEDEVFTLQGRREVADAAQGSAHWDAHYRFSGTGRLVDNSIDAAFTFGPDGLILTHRDRFDFWRWSRQALGTPGTLLGWTPLLRAKVRGKARGNLDRFLARTEGAAR
jgi:hypothetical protein